MATENKWEYDYSNIYHKPAAPSSYTNAGSSGTNAANTPADRDYYTAQTPPVQAPAEDFTAAPAAPQGASMGDAPFAAQAVSTSAGADDAGFTMPQQASATPTGAVTGMPPPPPYYASGAQGASASAPTRRTAKHKRPSKVARFLRGVAALVAVGVIAFVGGYYGSMYATMNSDTTVLVQQVNRDTSDVTSISTSTDGNDLSLVSAAALASQSVVVITTEQMVATSGWYGTEAVESGAGSGVIISEDGYILTCAHVVSDASNIIVTIDEVDYVATLIGSDTETDIAVIKIEATGLAAAVLGDSDALAVGETVIAVGNPLGELGGSVTQGIVSALNRVVVVESYEMTLIQMDASVSPGNSGGGLFNMAGELVGIVNAKSSDSDSEGIGFSIPINTAFALATSLIENGYITGRPELGIIALSISDADTAAAYGVNALGIYIYSVNEGSAAQAAGLLSGDRLISIDDVEISALDDLTNAIDAKEVGDVVTLLIARGGQMMTATVTLGEQGSTTATTTETQEEVAEPEQESTTPDANTGRPDTSTTPDAGTTYPDDSALTPDSGFSVTPDSGTTTPDSSTTNPFGNFG